VGLQHMYYTYVIRSLKDGSLYKGHCKDIDKRLQQHNAGMTRSIKSKTPYELKYYEEFESREEAIKREKYFKTAAGRRFLKKKID
jgi:putative endonuclease